ncbi:MAG: hypothetical protein P8182_17590 [Deltaproteobacteria bacterium]
MPTTQISLIREHTEKIRPPRALWVPFELGRPLGVPDDDAFQTRVLLSALKLIEARSGPVLEDFPEEAPLTEDALDGWACPISLETDAEGLDDAERLRQEFMREVNEIASWYELGVKKRGRTTFGVTGLDPQEIATFLTGFLHNGVPENPRDDLPLGLTLKLAAEDLKTYYFEAVTAQPGRTAPAGNVLWDWF